MIKDVSNVISNTEGSIKREKRNKSADTNLYTQSLFVLSARSWCNPFTGFQCIYTHPISRRLQIQIAISYGEKKNSSLRKASINRHCTDTDCNFFILFYWLHILHIMRVQEPADSTPLSCQLKSPSSMKGSKLLSIKLKALATVQTVREKRGGRRKKKKKSKSSDNSH